MTLKQHVRINRHPLPVSLDEVLEHFPRETLRPVESCVDVEHKAGGQLHSVLCLILGLRHSATVPIERLDRQIIRLIVTDLTDSSGLWIWNGLMSDWIILVTDGTVIEYAPEAYNTLAAATFEARRWALILSRGVDQIEEAAPDRWRVANRDVRIVRATGAGDWVGTFWTWDGYPDPEAVLFETWTDARAWAVAPMHEALEPDEIEETEWSAAATFVKSGEEAYAVVNKLKRIAPKAMVDPPGPRLSSRPKGSADDKRRGHP
jgi:hypothetical protein